MGTIQRKISYLKQLLLIMGLSLTLSNCAQNLFQKQEKIHPIDASARELERGNVDKAIEFFILALPEDLRNQINFDNINPYSIEKIRKALEGHKRKSEIFGLLSKIISRKSGIDLVELGKRISELKDVDPKDLISEIMKSLSSEGDITAQINAAIAASKIAGNNGASGHINDAILHSASIASKLKTIDIDGDNSVSIEELKNLSEEDSNLIHASFEEVLASTTKSLETKVDDDVKKTQEKLQAINDGIKSATGNSGGEKVKNFLGDFLEVVEPEGNIIEAPIDTPPVVVVTPPTDNLIKSIDGKRIVNSMAILGDSVAVGIGADFDFGSSFDLSEISSKPGIAGLLADMNVTGFEKYKGVNSEQSFMASYDSAFWARQPTVTDCKTNMDPANCFSHAARLKVPNVISYAKNGSKITEIENSQLPALINSGGHFDYIVLNVGGNDFCSTAMDLVKFENSFRNVLRQLYDYKSQPIVLISGIPDVISVFENVPSNAVGLTINSSLIGKLEFTCSEMRQRFCSQAVANKGNLGALYPRLNSMRDIVARVISEIDFNGNRLVFGDEVHEMRISEADVSVDCFHPSRAGHRKISDLTFTKISIKVTSSSP